MEYGRPYFCPVVSIFLLSFYLFSSPNLSGRRLDVYHTSTHGVVLVRISNACLKCGARGSLKYRTQKSPAAHHRTALSGCVFATKACIDNLKKNLLNGNISSTCPHNIVNIGALAAEIDSRVWGTTANFNRYRVLALIVTAATSLNRSQRNFARHLPSPGLAHYIQGLLPPDGILPRAKLTLRPSLAFSYTGMQR